MRLSRRHLWPVQKPIAESDCLTNGQTFKPIQTRFHSSGALAERASREQAGLFAENNRAVGAIRPFESERPRSTHGSYYREMEESSNWSANALIIRWDWVIRKGFPRVPEKA
jgi:hypothetical protein